METIKFFLYCLASVIMAGVIIFAPEASDNVAVFYVSILSTYLGLDIWSMIKSTSLLPPGEYKDIKVWRYGLCAVSYSVLIILAYLQSAKTGCDFGGTYSVLVSAVFLLVTMLIGALEGNKIATGKKECEG